MSNPEAGETRYFERQSELLARLNLIVSTVSDATPESPLLIQKGKLRQLCDNFYFEVGKVCNLLESARVEEVTEEMMENLQLLAENLLQKFEEAKKVQA